MAKSVKTITAATIGVVPVPGIGHNQPPADKRSKRDVPAINKAWTISHAIQAGKTSLHEQDKGREFHGKAAQRMAAAILGILSHWYAEGYPDDETVVVPLLSEVAPAVPTKESRNLATELRGLLLPLFFTTQDTDAMEDPDKRGQYRDDLNAARGLVTRAISLAASVHGAGMTLANFDEKTGNFSVPARLLVNKGYTGAGRLDPAHPMAKVPVILNNRGYVIKKFNDNGGTVEKSIRSSVEQVKAAYRSHFIPEKTTDDKTNAGQGAASVEVPAVITPEMAKAMVTGKDRLSALVIAICDRFIDNQKSIMPASMTREAWNKIGQLGEVITAITTGKEFASKFGMINGTAKPLDLGKTTTSAAA